MRRPLDPARLAGVGVEVLPDTPSTNALVAARARSGAPEWLVVATEHQTAGRGRLERTWETPSGVALTFSVLLRPVGPGTEWPWLPLLAGLAVVDALQEHDVAAGLKWPNDVMLPGPEGEAKVAGILVERVEGPGGAAAVLGIGLNVHQTSSELPVAGATSVHVATGRDVDRTRLLESLLAHLRRWYGAWSAGGGAALRPSYATACLTLGREVRVELPGGQRLSGTATDVDEGGRLVVDGTAVAAGDVVHVRQVG